MFPEDIIKALEKLPFEKYSCCVDKIENGIIYMSNFQKFSIRELLRGEEDVGQKEND